MEEKKNSVLNNIIAWFFGVLFILTGILAITDSIPASLIIIFSGALLLPPVRKYIQTKLTKIKSWHITVLSIILMSFGVSLIPLTEATFGASIIRVLPYERVATSSIPDPLVQYDCGPYVEKININEKELSTADFNKICDLGLRLDLADGKNTFDITFVAEDEAIKYSEILQISFDEAAYQEAATKEETEQEEATTAIETDNVLTKQEFESSKVFKDYKLKYDSSWDLLTGELNTYYNVNAFEEYRSSLEIQTNDNEINSFGLLFNGDDITNPEFAFLEDLLQFLSGEEDVSKPISFIRENAAKYLEDDTISVSDTTPFTWENLEIRATQIGIDGIFSSHNVSIDLIK